MNNNDKNIPKLNVKITVKHIVAQISHIFGSLQNIQDYDKKLLKLKTNTKFRSFVNGFKFASSVSVHLKRLIE